MAEVIERRTDARRRRKAERPQEILEAAFAEFSSNGYAMTTLDQIAERAGVTKGTIYVYFESKEHLFITMVRELMKVTLDTLQEMLEFDAKAEEEAIDLYKEIIKQAASEGDSTTRLLFEEILAEEEDHHDAFTTLLGK